MTLSSAMDKYVGEENENLVVRGGRTLGLSQLRKALTSTKNYKDDAITHFKYISLTLYMTTDQKY